MQNRVFIGLGSNLGEREVLMEKALTALKAIAAPDSWRVSSLYETVSVGQEGPDYLNAVCSFTTDLSADFLHQTLMELERDAGRTRSFPNAPRVLDLDLLFYDSKIITNDNLIVPHPRLHERAFVLVPLREVSPGWTHPKLNKTVDEMLALLPAVDLSGVKKYENHTQLKTVSNHA